jgi:hypothetical protein
MPFLACGHHELKRFSRLPGTAKEAETAECPGTIDRKLQSLENAENASTADIECLLPITDKECKV